jgi:hypothetical protein
MAQITEDLLNDYDISRHFGGSRAEKTRKTKEIANRANRANGVFAAGGEVCENSRA